jgi:hypothetical protein
MYIAVDPETSDFQMLITYKASPTSYYKSFWWGLLINATADLLDYAAGDYNSYLPHNARETFGVSKVGSFWGSSKGMILRYNNINLQYKNFNISTNFNGQQDYPLSAPTFIYDNHNTPYLVCTTTSYFYTSPSQLHIFDYLGNRVNYIDNGLVGSLNDTIYNGSKRINSNSPINPLFLLSDNLIVGMISISNPAHTSIDNFCIFKVSEIYEGTNNQIKGKYGSKDCVVDEVSFPRYHWNGSNWVRNYYAPAIESISGLNGKRHNFETESHNFNNRAYIDCSDAFYNLLLSPNFDYANTGFTITLKINPLPKNSYTYSSISYPPTFYTDYNRHVLFSIQDENLNNHFVFYNNNASNASSILNGGIGTTEETQNLTSNIALNTDSTVVVTFKNNVVNIYVNGVKLLTRTLTNALNFSSYNASFKPKFSLGANRYTHNNFRSYEFVKEFFRGTITDLQFYSFEFSQTEVDELVSTPTLADTSFLTSRFLLTESLEGLETKPTHTNYQQIGNIEVSFTGAANPQNITDGEFLTFGVCDGILKDNVTSYTYSFYLTTFPNDFITEYQKINTDTVLTKSVAMRDIYRFPGSLNGTCLTTYFKDCRTRSYDTIALDSDFSFVFKLNQTASDGLIVGLSTQSDYSNSGAYQNDFIFALVFNDINRTSDSAQTSISWFKNSYGTATIIPSLQYKINDEFKIAYELSTNEYVAYKYNTTTTVFDEIIRVARTDLNTFTKISASVKHAVDNTGYYYAIGLYAIKLTRTIKAQYNLIYPTDSNFERGVFSNKYQGLEGISNIVSSECELKADGVDLILSVISNIDNDFNLVVKPVDGTALVHVNSGWIMLSDNDFAKVITGKYKVLYKPLGY